MLPEDLISGLAMQGKPVALSRGATMLGIRAALTVGHARLSLHYQMLVSIKIKSVHAMQQPVTNITGTQLQLLSNVQLTRRSLVWPTVSAALIPSVVAPRLRATGLPCIANPKITSSGNTQHLGTEITALSKLAEA